MLNMYAFVQEYFKVTVNFDPSIWIELSESSHLDIQSRGDNSYNAMRLGIWEIDCYVHADGQCPKSCKKVKESLTCIFQCEKFQIWEVPRCKYHSNLCNLKDPGSS